MNKSEFVATVAKKLDTSMSSTSSMVDTVLETIREVVSSGDSVRFPGFGSFEISHRAETKGRNPSTGAEIVIPARKVPKFSAGKTFKESVNK